MSCLLCLPKGVTKQIVSSSKALWPFDRTRRRISKFCPSSFVVLNNGYFQYSFYRVGFVPSSFTPTRRRQSVIASRCVTLRSFAVDSVRLITSCFVRHHLFNDIYSVQRFRQCGNYATRSSYQEKDPHNWTAEEVYLWAIESVGLDTEDASILKNQKVNGKALLSLTKAELQNILPLGPATLVATAIQNLKKQVSIPEIVTRGKVLGSRLQTSTIPMNPEWVDRWGIKDRIGKSFDQQMNAYEAVNRLQDFRFWVIAGGSGIGKTRTGQEVPKLLAEKLKNNNAHSVHTYIRADLCPLQFPLKDVGGTEYARIPDNIDQAGKWLSLGIAAWYFAHSWSDSTLRVFQGESEAFLDFIVVIKAIRLSEQMKGVLQEDQTLVLFLQIDEFQQNIHLVRAALRFIRNHHLDLRDIKVLMIPILTGTYPLGIEELQKIYVTDYMGDIITLPPLSQQESENLLRAALSLHKKPYPNDGHPALPFYKMLLSYMGGIPHFIVKCAKDLPSDLSQLADKIWQKQYFHTIRMNLERTYNDRQLWLSHFGKESAVITFLRMAWFRERVTRDTTLNGKTIGDLEESGLIYLERTLKETDAAYTIAVPPILLLILDRVFQLNIFRVILIEGLVQLSPDNFPDFVMAMHKATYQIMWLSKPSDQSSVQITIRKIYNDAAEGNSQLDQQISIASEPIIVSAHKNITDLRNVYIREQNTPIDATKGTYLISTKKMAPDADGILPHGFEQYKWSGHLTEGEKIEVTSGNKSDPKLWTLPQSIKKEYSKCDKMRPNKITALRPFVMISPKPYQGLYDELPPNTLLVCGRRALMKFGRGFLSDCTYPLDETQKRWEAVGDQLYNELEEWMRDKNLSDQDMTRARGYLQLLRVSDRDGDGKLNRTELEDLLYRIKKLSKNIDVGQLISEVDTSNTGFITLTNFLDASFGMSSSKLAELLREGASIPPEEMTRRRGRPKN